MDEGEEMGDSESGRTIMLYKMCPDDGLICMREDGDCEKCWESEAEWEEGWIKYFKNKQNINSVDKRDLDERCI